MTQCPECKDRRVVGAGQAAEPCECCAVDLTAEMRRGLMVSCFERLIQAHSKATLALLLADMTVQSGSTRAEVEAFERDLGKHLQGWSQIAREYNATKRFNARIAALEDAPRRPRGRERRRTVGEKVK